MWLIFHNAGAPKPCLRAPRSKGLNARVTCDGLSLEFAEKCSRDQGNLPPLRNGRPHCVAQTCSLQKCWCSLLSVLLAARVPMPLAAATPAGCDGGGFQARAHHTRHSPGSPGHPAARAAQEPYPLVAGKGISAGQSAEGGRWGKSLRQETRHSLGKPYKMANKPQHY